MPNNKVGYGLAQISRPKDTLGRVFVVCGTSGANFQDIITTWLPDSLGVVRSFTTITDALAACTTGRGDMVLLSPDFTTAATAAELLSAETKGVVIVQAGAVGEDGVYVAYRATAALPQSTAAAIFTVTGRVKLVGIYGTVTTVIQTQACNTKLTHDATAAGLANVDICAVLDITADAVGVVYSITGTFANALVGASNAAAVSQAVPVTLEAGSLLLDCAASNTGSVKWAALYVPLDPGARMFAA